LSRPVRGGIGDGSAAGVGEAGKICSGVVWGTTACCGEGEGGFACCDFSRTARQINHDATGSNISSTAVIKIFTLESIR